MQLSNLRIRRSITNRESFEVLASVGLGIVGGMTVLAGIVGLIGMVASCVGVGG